MIESRENVAGICWWFAWLRAWRHCSRGGTVELSSPCSDRRGSSVELRALYRIDGIFPAMYPYSMFACETSKRRYVGSIVPPFIQVPRPIEGQHKGTLASAAYSRRGTEGLAADVPHERGSHLMLYVALNRLARCSFAVITLPFPSTSPCLWPLRAPLPPFLATYSRILGLGIASNLASSSG